MKVSYGSCNVDTLQEKVENTATCLELKALSSRCWGQISKLFEDLSVENHVVIEGRIATPNHIRTRTDGKRNGRIWVTLLK